MTEPSPIEKADRFSALPPPWPESDLRQRIAAHYAARRSCLVALDDDPTGTQTVHDVWVLTCWEVADLVRALAAGEPALYVLTNSRSLPLAEAQALNSQVAANLVQAARQAGRPIRLVSRSDSTLRGHFPGEVDALAAALTRAQGAPFDGICLIPFFAAGQRYTIDDIHWVQEGTRLVPAAQTPYASDPAFGYRHSRLPEWVEEKTGGRIRAGEVISISIETLRQQGAQAVAARLKGVSGGQVVIVNAADDRDLEVFAWGLAQAEAQGKRFLLRTAASFVKVGAGISDRPLLSPRELRPPRQYPVTGKQSAAGGLIVFGSYVPKSSAQLEAALAVPGLEAMELPVPEVLNPAQRQRLIEEVAAALSRALRSGKDGLVYTSRKPFTAPHSREASLKIGRGVSQALVEVVRRVEVEPRYVIGKGGITSSDLATEGLGVRSARVLGQIYPGVPVWRLGPDSRWPGMPYIVFPGNVGEAGTVAEIIQMLRAAEDGQEFKPS